MASTTQHTVISHNYSISSAYVDINSNSSIPWYVNANSTYAVPWNMLDLQTTVTTYEMGHALGLTHPQQCDGGPTDPVMACAQNCSRS